MVLTVNVVNSALVALVLASYMEQIRWWIFFGLVVTLTGVRAIGWGYYLHRRNPVEATTKWAIFATAGSGLSGLLWGAGSTLLLPDYIVERTFLAFVIGGMCAGALVSLSYYLPAFIAYVFSAALPLAGSFLFDGKTVYVAMGCMALVFVAAVTFAAHHFNRAFVSGMRLNLDLSERTKELTQRTEGLTAANSRLEAEIAQRKVTEDQLRQAQKLEAVGQLTGGIAHDFTNLLTAVVNYVELAIRRADDNPAVVSLLQGAVQAADRGIDLVKRLLAFARKQRLEPRSADLKVLISDIKELLQQTLGGTINLEIAIAPDLAPARVDTNQLELAVLNLAINARDAMPTGGTMRLSLENSRTSRGMPAGLAPADYVILSIADTGTGMDEATLARAFDPFFTTKQAGSGSGLGLSMVQGFAAQSAGEVQIQSRLGEGTRVEVWLPRADEAPTVGARPHRPDIIGPQRAAQILLCDDDPDVRRSLGEVLQTEGYILHVADGPSATLRILEGTAEIDLLIVDYAMPQMNGLELIRKACQQRPGLKTLLITGNVGVLSGDISTVPLLPKPFGPDELGQRVAGILAA